MNKERMLQLANRIENASPENFHMGAWFGRVLEEEETYDLQEEFPINADQIYAEASLADTLDEICDANLEKLNCGTTACLAGWAVLDAYFSQSTDKIVEPRTKWNGYYYAEAPLADDLGELNSIINSGWMRNWAKDYLGLAEAEAQDLFYCTDRSVWDRVKLEYGLNFNSTLNATWSIHPKVVADVLRRIVNGEIVLNRIHEASDEE